MKKTLFLSLLFILVSCQESNNGGKVVSIADGDTFTMLDEQNNQVKVRLYGVDSPERGQDYGANAKARLGELIFGEKVKIEIKDIDRYKRTVAIVYNRDGINVNEQLLKEGLVWHYKVYDDNPLWAEMEKEARKEKRGLWAGRKRVAPWQWRKDKRNKKSAAGTAD